MYVPRHFELPDDYVTEFLNGPRTGNLITVHADGPAATLVPFYRDTERNALVTHLVRNNPQVREPITGPGLVVFDDVDAYVSPRWYATNEVKANVPTWDYITVHVLGSVRIDPSPEAALRAARRLTELSEPDDVLGAVGKEKLERMARAIVAVEVGIERVQGKAKMSQNRHPDDIRSLAAELTRQGQDRMAEFLLEVSLPYAEQRYATLARLGEVHALREDVKGVTDSH
ncbi:MULTISPECIES: FMN-binding negative transcriptional regulator [unclassified Actinomyces]|uniref:FMN-binding negative transcriptional regulator n=1 Tax=unclassified Actinomyces TaxID=2609248 RepID=UPI0013A6A868|nr:MULTISPECIES: FMN-binding negative transcriptional regulator [unclassified Actinomyces]MBW3070223.1 FMN-binding negative transcriptional regulator [Actinomyces sp. 594]NDR52709.1 FMN-binding negative transcriptional regulator [Actinomyces sp. 565]